MKLGHVIIILVWSVIISAGVYGCANHEPENAALPATVDDSVALTDYQEPQIVYVDRWQTITVTEPAKVTIVTENVTIPLQPFTSIDELRQFVDNWKSNNWLMATTTDHQCEFYALKLQADAQAAGYLINFQVTGFHAENSAVIGNDIWFIEPQTGEIRLWGYLE